MAALQYSTLRILRLTNAQKQLAGANGALVLHPNSSNEWKANFLLVSSIKQDFSEILATYLAYSAGNHFRTQIGYKMGFLDQDVEMHVFVFTPPQKQRILQDFAHPPPSIQK
jgi:hypothetical protein